MKNNYRKLGLHHGTATHYDRSKPDTDVFLAYMEARLPAHGVEDYLDGFFDSMNGEVRRDYPQLRGLMKEGT